MPARYEEALYCPMNGDVFILKAKNQLSSLGWDVISLEDYRVDFRAPMSFWSVGERIVLKISKNGYFELYSECVNPLQIFDWGKNRSNIEIVKELIGSYSKDQFLLDSQQQEPTSLIEDVKNQFERR